MKKYILLIFVAFLLSFADCYAVSSDGFVMNVILDDKPVNEIVGNEVAIPFNSEYKLRLKNNNTRGSTVRITIDGVAISMLGDLILRANEEIDLERFIDQSLEEGKRFKFVPLDNPEVDDPSRKENGEIVAEFRMEKEETIYIGPAPFSGWEYYENNIMLLNSTTLDVSTVSTLCSADVQPGATIGGSQSTQRFYKAVIDVEDRIYKLTLKIVGLHFCP